MFDGAFRKVPFLRVLLPLAGGIILARFFSPSPVFTWIMAGFFILLLFLLLPLSGRYAVSLLSLAGWRNGMMAGIFQGLFLCMGLMMGREEKVEEIPEAMLQARICDEILEGERTFKTRLDRVYYRSGEDWSRLDGGVQVYFGKERRCRDLRPGDCITVSGSLQRYKDPKNPFEFNYRAYQHGKGLYYQLYLDSTSWIPIPVYEGKGLRIRSKEIRRSLMERINANIDGRDEKAILYSLLLGYRAELGQDVKQQFVRSGSMHILAVSGLHVGILYVLPAFLIGKIRGSFFGRLLATMGLFLLLWSYAMITGFSPSVVRAVTMCSVHRMALLMGRKAGIFHVLSLTAFLMILSRPGILFEAGFQLSFAAVAGIAGFQKSLYNMLPARGWLARKTWQLMTVSLSAQLGTAPLAIFYFHQFSNVFILSNLVVIPLATLILYVGLAFMLLSPLGLYPFSGILEWLTSLLCGMTHLMGRIPGAFCDNLSLMPVQVGFWYLAILLCGFFLSSRRVVLLHAGMVSILLLLLVSCIREYRIRSHTAAYVFSIPRETAIGFVRGKTHFLYRAGNIRGDSLMIPYAIRNFCVFHKLSSPVFLSGSTSGEKHIPPGLQGEPPGWPAMAYGYIDTKNKQLLYTVFNGRRLLIIRKMDSVPKEAPGAGTDILVLLENVSCNLDSLMNVFKPGLVIVDGSSFSWYHEVVDSVCIQHGIDFHSTEKDGYYVF